MEGRAFRVDNVNFDKGSVSLQDVALAEMRMPIFREEPLAVVRELYEQEGCNTKNWNEVNCPSLP